MATTDRELSRGVVAFLRRGQAASPGADEDAVRVIAGDMPSDMLVDRVRALVAESVGVHVDWDSRTLADAGRAVAAEMAARHPDLDRAALDALAWNFTFVWR